MKYPKHLMKIALLSSLALSFGVKADGTLPLPLPVTKAELPVSMKGKVDGQPRRLELSIGSLQIIPNPQPAVSRDVSNPCADGEQFYDATGTLVLNDEQLSVRGVCAPSVDSKHRMVIATDGSAASAKKLVSLDGEISSNGSSHLSSFAGNMKVQALGAAGTQLGAFALHPQLLSTMTVPGLVSLGLTPVSATSLAKFQLNRQ